MKRRGKSPPLQAQVRRHDKPYVVQDRTGGEAAGFDYSLRRKKTPGNVALLVRGAVIHVTERNDRPSKVFPSSTESGLSPRHFNGSGFEKNHSRPFV